MAQTAILALEDGTVFHGISFGSSRDAGGEVVFNTSMTGYQEIITDPSYKGQLVTMTYPLIGNYGVNEEDVESEKPQVEAFIVKELSRIVSNYRATDSLDNYLAKNDIPGIQGIDTRMLTKHIREKGAMRCCLTSSITNPDEAVDKAREVKPMEGSDFVKEVSCKSAYEWDPTGELSKKWLDDYRKKTLKNELPETDLHIVAIDCGIKWNILRCMRQSGFKITVVPAGTSAEDILRYNPDGLFLSNGPGDPAAVPYVFSEVEKLIGKLPIFGICLGHQMLGLAFGGKTFKLKFGHRGGNQPVMDLQTGKVEITSQNHGFAVDYDSLDNSEIELSHINLNDKTSEGLRHKKLPIFSVQYHPEASPGPHDAFYLFKRFRDMIKRNQTRMNN